MIEPKRCLIQQDLWFHDVSPTRVDPRADRRDRLDAVSNEASMKVHEVRPSVALITSWILHGASMQSCHLIIVGEVLAVGVPFCLVCTRVPYCPAFSGDLGDICIWT